MSKNEYYIAEIAAMSYFWFLKEHLTKTLKFKNIFFNNPVIDNTLNFILFPFLLIGSPIVAFFQKQYCEDLSNKNSTMKVENFVTYSSKDVTLFRNENNDFDPSLLAKNTNY